MRVPQRLADRERSPGTGMIRKHSQTSSISPLGFEPLSEVPVDVGHQRLDCPRSVMPGRGGLWIEPDALVLRRAAGLPATCRGSLDNVRASSDEPSIACEPRFICPPHYAKGLIPSGV